MPSPVAPVPLGDYALLGDTRSAALVSAAGSIDWLCLPRFDADPVFGSLVGGATAGHFAVTPAGGAELVQRRYRPASTVLETTWRVGSGTVTLTEGMVAEVAGLLLPGTVLVRRVTCTGAPARVQICFDPRRGERRLPPRVRRRAGGVVCSWGAFAVELAATSGTLPVGTVVEIDVDPSHPLTLVMTAAERAPLVHLDPEAAWALLLEDEARWGTWCDAIRDTGPYREAVTWSLLVLRLLTYAPSGAPVAAPTTSLPEEVGGSRNWDYRYAWPRDASIGIAAFLGVGRTEEARAFLLWLLHASRLDRPRLPPTLTLYGQHVRGERALDGWPGYADSRPVRWGNAASRQHQLDVYGWVVDAAWVLEQAGQPPTGEAWRALTAFTDLVARRWPEPDAGIWEVRGPTRHYVHSKLMAWLALDRALRLADRHRARRKRTARWVAARAAVAAEVLQRGWDPTRQTFVRAYGRDDLDAALLVLPLLDFEPATSPRVVGTVRAVQRELAAGGPLLYRYPPAEDGLPGHEGAFLPCSFWLAQALARIGEVDEAQAVFEAAATYASPLGLFPEEVDPVAGTPLGNYPQALTHAALVQAALAIRDATEGPTASPGPRRTPREPRRRPAASAPRS